MTDGLTAENLTAIKSTFDNFAKANRQYRDALRHYKEKHPKGDENGQVIDAIIANAAKGAQQTATLTPQQVGVLATFTISRSAEQALRAAPGIKEEVATSIIAQVDERSARALPSTLKDIKLSGDATLDSLLNHSPAATAVAHTRREQTEVPPAKADAAVTPPAAPAAPAPKATEKPASTPVPVVTQLLPDSPAKTALDEFVAATKDYHKRYTALKEDNTSWLASESGDAYMKEFNKRLERVRSGGEALGKDEHKDSKADLLISAFKTSNEAATKLSTGLKGLGLSDAESAGVIAKVTDTLAHHREVKPGEITISHGGKNFTLYDLLAKGGVDKVATAPAAEAKPAEATPTAAKPAPAKAPAAKADEKPAEPKQEKEPKPAAAPKAETPAAAAAAEKPAKAADAAAAPKAKPAADTITVKPGDNLGAIAAGLGEAKAATKKAMGEGADDLTIRMALAIALAEKNKIEKPDHITPGKKLHIPTEKEIGETVAKLKETLLKGDNKITAGEYKDQMKDHRLSEILTPPATPAAKSAEAAPAR